MKENKRRKGRKGKKDGEGLKKIAEKRHSLGVAGIFFPHGKKGKKKK